MKTIKDYFDISELVDKTVYDTYGESAWKFLDKIALQCLLIVREGIGKRMTCNNWKSGGPYDERGLRTNISPLVKKKTILYLSAHLFGKGFDFDVEGMTSTEVRAWIVANATKFPCKIRLERNKAGEHISWTHLDTMAGEKDPQVLQFDV